MCGITELTLSCTSNMAAKFYAQFTAPGNKMISYQHHKKRIYTILRILHAENSTLPFVYSHTNNSYTWSNSDVDDAAMLEVCDVEAVWRRALAYAWKLLWVELYTSRNTLSVNNPGRLSQYNSIFVRIKYTSNMVAWFYVRFNDVTAPHVVPCIIQINDTFVWLYITAYRLRNNWQTRCKFDKKDGDDLCWANKWEKSRKNVDATINQSKKAAFWACTPIFRYTYTTTNFSITWEIGGYRNWKLVNELQSGSWWLLRLLKH